MHTIPQVIATVALFIVADPFVALVMALFILGYVPTYFAHWRRWPLFGRIWSPIAGMSTVVAFHIVMGPEWDISMILLSQVVLPFCIFTQEERRLTLLFAMLPAVVFVVLEGFVTLGPFVKNNLSADAIRWFSMLPPTVACIDIYTRIRLLLDRIHQAVAESNEAHLKAVLADRAKSAFLANMSHEIRTPMNAVVGLSEILQNTPLNPEQRELVQNIRFSSRGLLRIINDILDFSRIDADKLDIQKRVFDLHECLDDVMSVLALKAQEKKLEFGMVISRHLPLMLEGDPDRLKQILFNLVGNAIKYTDYGSVRVRVSLKEATEQSVLVSFSVRDSGIGIRPEDISRVFDSFVQGDTSMTRRYGGTGLGLAISKQIVTLLGGEIGVESTVNKGSVFQFTARLEKHTDLMAEVPENLSRKHIAILTGSLASVTEEALFEMLSRLNCRVTTIKQGPQWFFQLSALSTTVPLDCVLIDGSRKPEIYDELNSHFTSTSGLSDTGWIFLSYPGREKYPTALSADRVKTLYKPLTFSALTQALTTLFDNGSPAPNHTGTINNALTKKKTSVSARILIVEDNAINQMVASKILKKLGHQSVLADNGQEAVDILKKEPFDLVLMDHQMPVLDGVSATKLIRIESTGVLNPRIPIIAVTASAMTGDREKFLDAGMNDYLPKPIIPADLAEMVSRWMKHNQMSEEEIKTDETLIEEP